MKYLVRPQDLKPYSPANHTGTKNLRLIGPETVGAKQVEVLIGEVAKGEGALPHAHPGIEQFGHRLAALRAQLAPGCGHARRAGLPCARLRSSRSAPLRLVRFGHRQPTPASNR